MPFSWAMRDFLPCRGQILPIKNHEALFSLLGNRFGGDGHTTFALPDLRPYEIDESDHGIRRRREWNENEIVPQIAISGMYPMRD